MNRGAALVSALVAVTAGCYRYIPETRPLPEPGVEYRAWISAAEAAPAERLLGRDVESFDGRVIAVSDTVFEFQMGATRRRNDPRPVVWSGERLAIPKASIARFERRELDRPRTFRAALLYGGGTILAGSIWLSIKGRATGSGGEPPPPPP